MESWRLRLTADEARTRILRFLDTAERRMSQRDFTRHAYTWELLDVCDRVRRAADGLALVLEVENLTGSQCDTETGRELIEEAFSAACALVKITYDLMASRAAELGARDDQAATITDLAGSTGLTVAPRPAPIEVAPPHLRDPLTTPHLTNAPPAALRGLEGAPHADHTGALGTNRTPEDMAA